MRIYFLLDLDFPLYQKTKDLRPQYLQASRMRLLPSLTLNTRQ
jgi:hypothetical protein